MVSIILNSVQATQFFKTRRIANIKDIRAVDTDMMLVFTNGDNIVLKDGALMAVVEPELMFTFIDGTLKLGQFFQQIEKIEKYLPSVCDDVLNCMTYFGTHADLNDWKVI